MDPLPLPSFIATAVQNACVHVLGSRNGSTKETPLNPLSYPKSRLPYSSKLFKNPSSEYRGCPFWAWNNKLNKEQLLRQVDIFAEMGMGGFHMHARTGLDTEYLGTEFLDLIRACVERAESKGLLACLYDEDRWPSGTAGGKVIKDNPDFAQKRLKFTPNFYDGPLLAAYNVELDENGCLNSSRMLKKEQLEEAQTHALEGNLWFAFMETRGHEDWYNGETYVDTLSKEAMAHFIELTHEKYKAKIGDKFGTVVPCIFTDEPEFNIMNQLDDPWAKNDVWFAWTRNLLESYTEEYSSNLLEHLPELVWNLPDGKPSLARWRYHEHTCERFVSAFMDQLAAWCGKNNLMLNGHMMEEPSLRSQTNALGEAMRCYRNMQMPGMDLLVDWMEYNTAKQVSSVGRQNGLRGAMSELYGVTHWDFTFEGHKGQGDWQAALGITFRVHHLAWVSMAGEGKRDYPASIGYQSPWYKEYGYVEDHFARVNVAMTRGKALTRVAVIHPIESYWLSVGPNNAGDERDIRDQAFGDLTNWLLHGLIDFDFISESLFPGQVSRKRRKGKLIVGACEYDVVILPNLKTIRSTTLKILREFSKSGGKVIIAGSAPSLVDAGVPSSNPTIENSKSILWSQQDILHSLEEHRELGITIEADLPKDKFLYQMRKDGEDRYVFICNRDRNSPVPTRVRVKGSWALDKMDTLTGEESKIDGQVSKGWTIFPYRFEGCESLLLRLSPSSTSTARSTFASTVLGKASEMISDIILEDVRLSEPNVLVLDYAQFKLNDDPWSEEEEVLRVDNIVRGRLGFHYKGQLIKQPWVFSPDERAPKARLSMRFALHSDFTVSEGCMLALEDSDSIIIQVNDVLIPTCDSASVGGDNWWVDQDIHTVPIPRYLIHRGTNTVTLSMDFGALTNLERIYILGNFSVSLNGHEKSIQPIKRSPITWGDIVPQGFPFYVGNLVYKCSFTVPSSTKSSKSRVTLSVPQFSSPVIAVHNSKSREKIGRIALQPHKIDIGEWEAGKQEIEITAFGNRYNSFGHFHAPEWVTNCYPGIWRTGGGEWTDSYALKRVGVLEVPTISIESIDADEEDTESKDSGEWVDVGRIQI